MKRRDFLALGTGAAALPFVARRSFAADYPTRPVQVIVGQAAGSSSDITARLLTQPVSQTLRQQFIVSRDWNADYYVDRKRSSAKY